MYVVISPAYYVVLVCNKHVSTPPATIECGTSLAELNLILRSLDAAPSMGLKSPVSFSVTNTPELAKRSNLRAQSRGYSCHSLPSSCNFKLHCQGRLVETCFLHCMIGSTNHIANTSAEYSFYV